MLESINSSIRSNTPPLLWVKCPHHIFAREPPATATPCNRNTRHFGVSCAKSKHWPCKHTWLQLDRFIAGTRPAALLLDATLVAAVVVAAYPIARALATINHDQLRHTWGIRGFRREVGLEHGTYGRSDVGGIGSSWEVWKLERWQLETMFSHTLR